jgi:hypothetical protein
MAHHLSYFIGWMGIGESDHTDTPAPIAMTIQAKSPCEKRMHEEGFRQSPVGPTRHTPAFLRGPRHTKSATLALAEPLKSSSMSTSGSIETFRCLGGTNPGGTASDYRQDRKFPFIAVGTRPIRNRLSREK